MGKLVEKWPLARLEVMAENDRLFWGVLGDLARLENLEKLKEVIFERIRRRGRGRKGEAGESFDTVTGSPPSRG